jgi:hypothetical protein
VLRDLLDGAALKRHLEEKRPERAVIVGAAISAWRWRRSSASTRWSPSRATRAAATPTRGRGRGWTSSYAPPFAPVYDPILIAASVARKELRVRRESLHRV